VNLVDSCGWMEYFCDSKMAKHYAAAIEQADRLVVPTICLQEVCRKILIEAGEQEALRAMATMRSARVVPLDDSLAIAAALAGRQYKLPLADSIVLATARLLGATIFTQDHHFEGLPQVRFFRKETRR